jgi:hypothetical protein
VRHVAYRGRRGASEKVVLTFPGPRVRPATSASRRRRRVTPPQSTPAAGVPAADRATAERHASALHPAFSNAAKNTFAVGESESGPELSITLTHSGPSDPFRPMTTHSATAAARSRPPYWGKPNNRVTTPAGHTRASTARGSVAGGEAEAFRSKPRRGSRFKDNRFEEAPAEGG